MNRKENLMQCHRLFDTENKMSLKIVLDVAQYCSWLFFLDVTQDCSWLKFISQKQQINYITHQIWLRVKKVTCVSKGLHNHIHFFCPRIFKCFWKGISRPFWQGWLHTQQAYTRSGSHLLDQAVIIDVLIESNRTEYEGDR